MTTLLDRAVAHDRDFPLEGFATFYARVGLGPNRAENYRFPQWRSCAFRRLLSNTYHLNRVTPRPGLLWPVRTPTRIVVVELRGERLCLRMRHLAFFEHTLRLSTIVNAQIPWASFESPLITCIEGHGRVGLRIEGDPVLLARGEPAEAEAPQVNLPQVNLPQVNLPRLAAWCADTHLGLTVEPGYLNAVLVAAATADVLRSSLVVSAREDGEEVAGTTLLARIARLIVP
jgi:hypothetical protein